MGARIAALIFLMTLFSYLHIFKVLRAEALDELRHTVLEHGQRVQALFVLAEDNHAILKKALEEHFEAWRQRDPSAAFEQLVMALPDGTLRNRLEGFDGTRYPCVFIPRGMSLDADMRRWMLAAHEVLSQYGPAFHVRFTDTYVTLPGGAVVLFWPESPDWCKSATPDFDSSGFEFFTLSTPTRDPSRKTVWSGIVGDPIAHTWTVSASTPVDKDGHHALTITQDILIEELMSLTINDHLPGTYNMLLREDGQLIAHPDLKMEGATEAYNLLKDISPANSIKGSARLAEAGSRAHLRQLFEWAFHHPEDEVTREFPEYGEYASAVRLKGPGWNLVTVLPERVVSADALRAARYVLGFGLLSLVLELTIVSWVLKQQLSRPLQDFTHATDQVAAGDFQISFENSRNDELGRLAQGFGLMAHEIQRREAALRQANEALESGIEERTRELQEKNLKLEEALSQIKEAQELLVEKERLASLGALMAGIAHEIKNPLNFVNNFAQLSMNLLEELHEELHGSREGGGLASSEKIDELLVWLRQNVGKIEEHGKRADGILRTMQMHSHIRAQAQEPTDLNALLEEHLSLASQNAQLTHPGLEVLLRKHLDPILGTVDMVPQDFGRALLNILSNSLYAVAEKRKQLGNGFTPEVTVSSQSLGSYVRILIRDNGIGIPRKSHDKIFNPFFTTKPAGVGVGLGLCISYDIVVRQHKGEIRIDSSEGQYTECFITLPRSARSRNSV